MRDLKSLRESKGFVKCKQCGTNNPNTVKTCRQCGAKLGMTINHTTRNNRLKKQGINPFETPVVETESQPIEGSSMSMLSLLAEEERQKKKKARFLTGVMVASCLTGVIGGYAWYDQRDYYSAQTAYANQETETLMELKEKMSSEDWQRFEESQAESLRKDLKGIEKKEVNVSEVLDRISYLITVVDDATLKLTLTTYEQQVQRILQDEEYYQAALEALSVGETLEAYKLFLKISPDYYQVSEVQKQTENLKATELKAWRVQLQQLADAKQYTEVVEEATLYLTVDPKDANVVALKKQAEKQVTTASPSEVEDSYVPPLTTENEETVTMVEEILKEEGEELPEESKTESTEEVTEKEQNAPSEETPESEPETKEDITYRSLKNGQTIQAGSTNLNFKLNRLTQGIWPEKMTSNSSAYQAEAGSVYFVYLFEISNKGNESIALTDLIQEATVTDGDNQTYEGVTMYYHQTVEIIGQIDESVELEPGKSMTVHATIQVPKELKTKVTPLTARIKVDGEWYEKEIPAQ